jgi:predicted DNA-binding protein (UPF0251 family)
MEPVVTYFKPRGVPLKELDVVLLSLEELEAVRLVDLEGLEQETAAQRMGISRRALWEDLQNARRKIVEALVKGKAIEIKGGDYTVERPRGYNCKGCSATWEIPFATGEPLQCPRCGSNDVQRNPDNLDDNGPKRCCQGRCLKERKGMTRDDV